MRNKTISRLVAFSMVAAMTVGSSTVFAADVQTSGETTGTGSSNGHLEQKVVKVTLPTVTGSTPFNYTIDPENLIGETNKDQQGTAVTANADNVYFKNKDGNYTSSSDLLEVINESSVKVSLTVKAEVTGKATDIALADAAGDIASATNPLLYLGLKVGADTETVKAAGATKTVEIDGIADNFEIKAKDGGGYEYGVIASPAEWKKTTIGLTGKCSQKEIKDETSAPAVKVTWSWSDPSAAPTEAAPSLTDDDTTYTTTANTAVNVGVSLGAGDLAAENIVKVEFVNGSGVKKPLTSSDYSFANNTLTLTTATVDAFRSSAQATRDYVITFDDTESTTLTFTLTK